MWKTRFCELFGVELPIMLAGMGTIALADLAAAVSEAGGMGTVGLVMFTPEGIHNEIAAARRLTKKPLACNLLIPFLQPGEYQVSAELAGFKKFVRSDLKLDVNQRMEIPVTLTPGETQESVQVTGEAPLLQTTVSSVGQVVDNKKVVDHTVTADGISGNLADVYIQI